MIDVHVHLEKGDYSVEWSSQSVAYAVKGNYGVKFSNNVKEWLLV